MPLSILQWIHPCSRHGRWYRETNCVPLQKSLKAENNYAQIDKEGLALIDGLKKFHQYLCCCNFTIVTDHKPLLGLFGVTKTAPQMLSPRMQHWTLTLAAYKYQIVHTGTKHPPACGEHEWSFQVSTTKHCWANFTIRTLGSYARKP